MRPLELFSRLRGFNTELRERRQRLYRVAYSWCQDTSIADDLVQESMTKAWKNIRSLRSLESMDSWLFNILANCWRDHLRRQKKVEEYDDEAIIAELVNDCEQERSELVSRVRQAIKELPTSHREVIALVDLEGFSYKEVSRLLDIPQGTVTSRVTRARESLRRRLKDLYMEVPGTQMVPLRRVK